MILSGCLVKLLLPNCTEPSFESVLPGLKQFSLTCMNKVVAGFMPGKMLAMLDGKVGSVALTNTEVIFLTASRYNQSLPWGIGLYMW